MKRFLITGLLAGFIAVPLGCGPSGQGTRGGRTHSIESSGGGGSGDTSKLLETSPPGTKPLEPNVPFAMSGGGPRHLFRAAVPGPDKTPRTVSAFHCGGRIAASPIIGPDGTIYIGAIDGSFNALKREGALRWSYVCDEPIFSTAAISQTGKVFVGCDDDLLHAFSTDGTLRWSYRMKQDEDSAPVISDDGIIYVGGEGLHAIDGDGRRRFKLWLGGHVSASPTVRPDGVIVVGSHDNRVYFVKTDGTVLASFETKGAILGPAAALENNDVVVGSDDGYVYRLAPGGGLRWKFKTLGPVRSGIAVSEDEKILFVTSMDGAVYALDAETGKSVWQQETAGPIAASPMLDAGGLLYVGSRDRHLYAFHARDGEIAWRIPVEGEIDATVAVAAGRQLIVADDSGAVRILEAGE